MKRERIQHWVIRTPRSSLHRDKIQLIDRLSLLSVVIHLIRSRDVCVTFEVTRVRCSLALLPLPSLPIPFPNSLAFDHRIRCKKKRRFRTS